MPEAHRVANHERQSMHAIATSLTWLIDAVHRAYTALASDDSA